MSPSKELGKNILHHGSRNFEFGRALVWTFAALIVGSVGTVVAVNNPGKGDPTVLLWMGVSTTCLFLMVTLLWLVPAMMRRGQTVDFYEKGIVVNHQGKSQQFLFIDIKSAAEDSGYHPILQDATRYHTLELTSIDGRRVTLSSGALHDWDVLLENVLIGVTKALVPRIATALSQGQDERVNLALLTKDGILLDKTMGSRGTLVRWPDLVDVGIHDQLGHVLLQTREGVIDTGAYRLGIPLWFLFVPLAKYMTKGSPTKSPATR